MADNRGKVARGFILYNNEDISVPQCIEALHREETLHPGFYMIPTIQRRSFESTHTIPTTANEFLKEEKEMSLCPCQEVHLPGTFSEMMPVHSSASLAPMENYSYLSVCASSRDVMNVR